ncbi:MAG TPA: rRNA methyltransferase, partial [Planctomycetes bacterium]|nr:rRNA methyltransferase [Planctomycetota bacterium]
MRLTELLDSLQTLGARAPHQELFLRSWLAGTPLGEHAAHHRASYPKALQAALPELEQKRAALLSLVQERP